jgi:hypothetical protein
MLKIFGINTTQKRTLNMMLVMCGHLTCHSTQRYNPEDQHPHLNCHETSNRMSQTMVATFRKDENFP